jgi:hypothetical protein
MTPAFYANGLAARLLLAMPPRRVKKWSDAQVPDATMQAVADVFDALLRIPVGQDAQGDPEPGNVLLSPPATVAWVEFYNRHAQEQDALGGTDLAAAWSKLEGYAARLALVVHCIRLVAQEGIDPHHVDETTMKAGIALAKWFGHEAKRVYAVLGETPAERERRELVEVVERRGGRVTVRELERSSRQYGSAAEWKQALGGLVDDGLGRWDFLPPDPKGGRQSKVFVLLTQPAAVAPPDTLTIDSTASGAPASGGSVNCQPVNGGNGAAVVGAGADADRDVGEL